MATQASKLSNGQLKMQVHYNPSLGTTAETAKLVKQGQIQLSLQSPSDVQPFYGPMAMFSLPFLFSDIKIAVHSAYAGSAGQSLAAGLDRRRPGSRRWTGRTSDSTSCCRPRASSPA